ncbi:MAG: hypothetical protein ABIA67_04915 [Candidatus Margulisiibacteriota bacterium]
MGWVNPVGNSTIANTSADGNRAFTRNGESKFNGALQDGAGGITDLGSLSTRPSNDPHTYYTDRNGSDQPEQQSDRGSVLEWMGYGFMSLFGRVSTDGALAEANQPTTPTDNPDAGADRGIH